ncbi:MAG: polyribonucleotide nucleotidyltransferase, partial [Bacteroidetes Order II. Incertae sedis bacterium]|nr:polyribonucleotide nucleotidyltransferase [Bacteroidetes Order II. bacterium]
MMSVATIREVEIAPGKVLTLETGRLAKQAGGSVVARMGDTMVLCTAVLATEAREGQSFFPLTVDYREKFSAAGKIPGGFIKREGRSTDKETLSSRLIDRCLRPLFGDNFFNEVQIICSVMSADEDNDGDVVAGVGASAALMLAGAPFDGPIAQVRVGRVEGEYVINPTFEELASSDINLIVAGKSDAIVMVEGEMDEVSEEDMLGALAFGHETIKVLCQAQIDLVADFGGAKEFEFTPVGLPEGVVDKVRDFAADTLEEHILKPYSKETFYGGISDIKKQVLVHFLGEGEDAVSETEEGWTKSDIK